MTWARKVDANQAAIAGALRASGASVLDLSRVGQGCPDILAAKGEKSWLIEVKGPNGKLTPDQVRFHREWQGAVRIVTSIDDAAKVVAELRTGYLNGQPT